MFETVTIVVAVLALVGLVWFILRDLFELCRIRIHRKVWRSTLCLLRRSQRWIQKGGIQKWIQRWWRRIRKKKEPVANTTCKDLALYKPQKVDETKTPFIFFVILGIGVPVAIVIASLAWWVIASRQPSAHSSVSENLIAWAVMAASVSCAAYWVRKIYKRRNTGFARENNEPTGEPAKKKTEEKAKKAEEEAEGGSESKAKQALNRLKAQTPILVLAAIILGCWGVALVVLWLYEERITAWNWLWHENFPFVIITPIILLIIGIGRNLTGDKHVTKEFIKATLAFVVCTSLLVWFYALRKPAMETSLWRGIISVGQEIKETATKPDPPAPGTAPSEEITAEPGVWTPVEIAPYFEMGFDVRGCVKDRVTHRDGRQEEFTFCPGNVKIGGFGYDVWLHEFQPVGFEKVKVLVVRWPSPR